MHFVENEVGNEVKTHNRAIIEHQEAYIAWKEKETGS